MQKTKEELQAKRAEVKKLLQAKYKTLEVPFEGLMLHMDDDETHKMRIEILEIDELLDGMK